MKLIACLLFGMSGTVGTAIAATADENYPTKPIRLVVAYPPGGGVDLAARVIGPKLADALGQPVVIENRGGAGGNLAMASVARAAPDGYTLLLNSTPVAINPTLYKNLPFDTVADFTPVAMIASAAYVLVVPPSSTAETVSDLLAEAKTKPGMAFASSGVGTPPHLAGERLKLMTGVDLIHVPYKGTGPALADVMGGQVSLMFADVLGALPLVTSGRLKALGVTTPERFFLAPDLPTIAESGVPDFTVTGWTILLAPAGTPATIIDRLNQAILPILTMPDVQDKLVGDGREFAPNSPEYAADLIRNEIEKWGEVVRASGATVE